MSKDLEQLSDDQLVALCLEKGADDERPWSELFHRYRQLVWSVCRRYFRNREDAADMVQVSFMRALRGLAGFTGGHPALFPSWLVRIAGNACKNELRRRAKRLLFVEDEVTPEMSIIESTAGADIEEKRRRAHLRSALCMLSLQEQEILQLAEIDELPYRVIATRLDISLSAVKMRVLRARAALASALRTPGANTS